MQATTIDKTGPLISVLVVIGTNTNVQLISNPCYSVPTGTYRLEVGGLIRCVFFAELEGSEAYSYLQKF